MQSGDLVFFRGSGFISWLIRWWTRSDYSHVGVIWMVLGVPLVIEARLGMGVVCDALATRQKDGPTVLPSGRHLDLPLALRHLGDWYSIEDALRAGVGEYADQAGWECAELAATLLGYRERFDGWTPQNLLETVT